MSFIPTQGRANVRSTIIPVGTVVAYAGKELPYGWEYCDGRELNVNDYLELFNVITHTYGGSGDKFNLPNLVGRVIIGEDKDRLIIKEPYKNMMGGVDGELTHTLTQEELAKHKHTGKTAITGDAGGGTPVNYCSGDPDYGNPVIPRIETTEAGENVPHNNMQPYLILKYLIKTKPIDTVDNIITNTELSFSSPIGTIISFPSDTIPNGWLLCDGSSYPKALFPNLSSVLKNEWGGNSNNFNVPDLRGRTLVGADKGANVVTTNNNVSNLGGEEKHTLTVDELAQHSHIVSAVVGAHGDAYYSGGANADNFPVPNLPIPVQSLNTGSNDAHNNMQPYAVINYIIKATFEEEQTSYYFINSNNTITTPSAYFVDASGGNKQITLSSALQDSSKITIRKIDSSINTVNIIDQNNLQIDTLSSYTLSGSQPITIIKTTFGWFITQL